MTQEERDIIDMPTGPKITVILPGTLISRLFQERITCGQDVHAEREAPLP